MSNIIEVKDLVTEYSGKRVLDGISLNIPERKIFVILGGSGCGKTTLLKHIIGLLCPLSGSIKMFEKEIVGIDEDDLDKILKRCGVLFQNGALLDSLSVKENVAIPLRQHTNLDERIIQRLVATKLHLMELDYSLDLLPAELSGGMKKRVAMARAIALDPKILFCDEPSAGLDPVTSSAIDNLLIKLNEQLEMTIIVVTHELTSIHRIADNILFLENGKNLFTGTINDALKSDIKEIRNFFAKGKI